MSYIEVTDTIDIIINGQANVIKEEPVTDF